MRIRRRATVVARSVAVALALAVCACSGSGQLDLKPDAGGIVLVTVDALDAADLALYGGEVATPVLDRLAADGTAWRRAWTTIPLTRPAVATLLTGVTPDRSGVRDDLFSALEPDVPTLARLFAERGYRTAAFPRSNLLGYSSGLLDDFEVVDPPFEAPPLPGRRIPVDAPLDPSLEHFGSWLDSLGPDEPYFVWLHVSAPLIAALEGGELKELPMEGGGSRVAPDDENDRIAVANAYAAFDTILGRILEALDSRGLEERAALMVAGTMGSVLGSATEPRGPGFSVADRAVRIPLVARFPAGTPTLRAADEPVWAPDVAATLAELGGVRLAGRSEGISLFESAPDERVILGWSWAPLAQMGWRPLLALRSGNVARTVGYDDRTITDDGGTPTPAQLARLEESLLARAPQPAEPVPLESIRATLEAREIVLEPAPGEGRLLESADERVQVARFVWDARRAVRAGRNRAAMRRFGNVLRIEPENRAALFGRGLLMLAQGDEEAATPLARTVALYPGDPEVLHWYAHAIWSDSWEDAERLLDAVLPFKPQEADVLYDLACTRSLAGELSESERLLRAAVEAGYTEWQHMEIDPDLRNLRESGRFAAVMREVRQ